MQQEPRTYTFNIRETKFVIPMNWKDYKSLSDREILISELNECLKVLFSCPDTFQIQEDLTPSPAYKEFKLPPLKPNDDSKG